MNKHLLVLLLLFAFATSGFAQEQANARAQVYYHFSKARLLDEQGQGAQAIEEFKKALALDPDNSLIYSEMAESYLRNNRVREAVEAADNAVKVDPDNIDAHRILGSIYVQPIARANAQQPPSAETMNAAIREFEEIVRIDPTERQALLMLGRLYQIKGDRSKATEIYTKFLGIEPGSEEGVTALAKLHLDAGNHDEAVELLEEFVQQQPDSTAALETLGQAYSDMQEYEKAAAAYRRAGDLDPDDIELEKAEAQALFLANKFDDAAELYEDLAKADPDDGMALLRLGQIYRQQMKYDAARQNLQAAAKAFPDSVEVQFHLMLLDRDQGLIAEGLKRVADILKRTERSAGRYTESDRQNRRLFLLHQGILQSIIGQTDDAVRTFTELKSQSGDRDGRYDSMIIETYRNARNPDRALKYSEEALAASPDNRQLRMVHADLIAERGQVEEGIKALRSMALGNEQDQDLLSAMVNIYQRARKFGEAQDILDTMRKRFPEDEHMHFLQGALFEKQKKYPEAEQAFRRALAIQKDDPAVLNYLGYMLADRGEKLEEARDMIQKAVAADPTNGAYLDSLGWVYFKLDKMDLAEQYLKKAVIFVSNDSSMYDHLGDLYFRTNRLDEARSAWTKSLQLATADDEQEEAAKIKKKLDDLRNKRAANR